MTLAGCDSEGPIGNTDGPPPNHEDARNTGTALPLFGLLLLLVVIAILAAEPKAAGAEERARDLGFFLLGALLVVWASAVGGLLRARHAPAVVRLRRARWAWRLEESWAGRHVRAVDPAERRFRLHAWGLLLAAIIISTLPVNCEQMLRDPAAASKRLSGGTLWVGLLPIVLFAPGLYESLRRWRFGVAELRFEGPAPRLGGKLLGSVVVTRGLSRSAIVDGSLHCRRRTFRYAGDSDWEMTEVDVWATHFRFDPGEVLARGDGIELPLDIDVSASALPSDWADWQNQIVWALEVSSGSRVLGFRARFELPVFAATPHEPTA